MPEKLKPCPACGAPYPRMVEHEMFAYVACDTRRCRLTEEEAARKIRGRRTIRSKRYDSD